MTEGIPASTWLTTIVTVFSSVGGWAVGFWSASRLQQVAYHRDQKALAQALLADVRRIRTELGEGPAAIEIFGNTPKHPSVHRWVETKISSLGPGHLRTVELFMELERGLNNYLVFSHTLHERRGRVEYARSRLESISTPDRPRPGEALEDAMARKSAEGAEEAVARHDLRRAEDSFNTQLQLVENLFGRISETLAELAARLSPPLPDPVTVRIRRRAHQLGATLRLMAPPPRP